LHTHTQPLYPVPFRVDGGKWARWSRGHIYSMLKSRSHEKARVARGGTTPFLPHCGSGTPRPDASAVMKDKRPKKKEKKNQREKTRAIGGNLLHFPPVAFCPLSPRPCLVLPVIPSLPKNLAEEPYELNRIATCPHAFRVSTRANMLGSACGFPQGLYPGKLLRALINWQGTNGA